MDLADRSDQLHFTMGNGREVSINAVLIEQADDQMLKRFGYHETDHESIGRHRRKVMRLWGQPRQHFIQDIDHSESKLTPYVLTAWLSSGPIPSSNAGRSQMVVVVIVNYGRGQQIETLFNTYVASLDWDSLAWPVEEVAGQNEGETVNDPKMFEWMVQDLYT